MKSPAPIFFATPAEFRAWLKKNHARETEVLVGFHKRATGLPSMTWPQSVDEALCFGWIDGVRKGVNGTSYTIRFTPRKASSNWSAVNIGRVEELTKLKRMQPAGLAAFERRTEARSRIYSYEQRRELSLSDEDRALFVADATAWTFFQAQAPSYKHLAVYWILSAKREETRVKRLTILMQACARGKRHQ